MSARPDAALYALDAEKAVVGAALQDAIALTEARARIRVEAFADPRHQVLLEALMTLQDAGVYDVLTVTEYLRVRLALEKAGGLEYVAHLIDVVPTTANIQTHLELVLAAWERRRLATAGRRIADGAADPSIEPDQAAQQAIADLLPIAVPAGREGFVHVEVTLRKIDQQLLEREQRKGHAGIPTGFWQIDNVTGGWLEGELIIVGAVPKAFKSAMLMNWVDHAIANEIGCGVVTIEMSDRLWTERLIAKRARIDSRKLSRRGRLSDDEGRSYVAIRQELVKQPLWIDGTSDDLNTIVARCRALKAKHPDIRLLGVDYLQLIQAEDDEGLWAQELRVVSRALKRLAEELALPIVALAQLNDKEIERRLDKHPQLSDLQGSSGMRQSGDAIGLLYRPMMYKLERKENDRETLELDFAASRGFGTLKAKFDIEPEYLTIRERGTYRDDTEQESLL